MDAAPTSRYQFAKSESERESEMFAVNSEACMKGIISHRSRMMWLIKTNES